MQERNRSAADVPGTGELKAVAGEVFRLGARYVNAGRAWLSEKRRNEMRERDLREREPWERGPQRASGEWRDGEHGARSEYEAMREGGSGQRVSYPQGYSEALGGARTRQGGYGPSTLGRDPYGGEARQETGRYPGSQGYGGGSEFGSPRRTQRDDWEETRQYGQGSGMEYGHGRHASGWQSDYEPLGAQGQRGGAAYGSQFGRQAYGDYGRDSGRAFGLYEAQPRGFGEGYGRSSGYGEDQRYGHARDASDYAPGGFRPSHGVGQRVDFSREAGASEGTEWDRATQRADLGAGAGTMMHAEGPYRGRGPRNYRRSQERILEDINENLTYDPQIDASGIEVRCADGKVVLEGEVEGRWMKHRAEDIAEACAGSLEIDNRLRVVRSGDRSAAATRGAASGESTGRTAVGASAKDESQRTQPGKSGLSGSTPAH